MRAQNAFHICCLRDGDVQMQGVAVQKKKRNREIQGTLLQPITMPLLSQYGSIWPLHQQKNREAKPIPRKEEQKKKKKRLLQPG